MRQILVPTDLSDISENALRYAVKVASKTKGAIHLVNFTAHPFGASFTATGEIDKKYAEEESVYNLALLKRYRNDLISLTNKYKEDGVALNFEIYDEDFEDGVEKYIKEKGIDLVVMGTTGEENAKEIFTGNHAQQVVESAPCPVITVKMNTRSNRLSRIILGIDFDKDKNDNYVKAVSYINNLAADLGADIMVVHMADKDKIEKGKAKMEKFASDYGLSNYNLHIVTGNDPEEALMDFAEQNNADMLAILTHAEGGFFRIFKSSLSEELNKHSERPLLTVNLHTI